MVHAITLESDERVEEAFDSLKVTAMFTNPEMYQKMFADTKETVENEVDWVHPDEDELDRMLAALKENSG